ncbi:glycoside hydrolase family 35 protein [Aspergillus clavatus NRRL 1]|uniref:Probable beta-galactosidase C n=1 Tax=Aspergillus clavatus (strain ATCC 1007 / CBS 513.65 / DSM 816 / NCTC 3887 / NRRL 1 / QM 1276 / 107) TaxID=344612 RepID=BGALC_ASPCL|nr:beta-galactosidase, putative [Aspergillus clavatus NRRL 1]A1CE56.1 RecName: Full=Probable beta-galactosidase C; AltName: Full=Lactase C; Flags: Precursor [Aspergillus clavatus NRRL 1]EAW11155.1 beta-galactosidase, putative [Aspergillus clavatus NRRL 1]
MRILSLLFLLLLGFLAGNRVVSATDHGKTTDVTWDRYSLSVKGERLFVFSGEFHYQRLPVPEMWLDVFQKLRANGFNAISVYFFWGYHSASEGEFDFETGAHNIQRLFDYAKEAGIYVIARAGPYCNAETTAGGYALWAANGQMGNERTSDDAYYAKWRPWILEVGKIIAANQITNGGPVILNQHENELQETSYEADNTLVVYMKQIARVFQEAGIVVPSSHNEKGMRAVSWSTDHHDVGGAVNIYGLDSYPGGLSCTNPSSGFNLVRTYYQWFQNSSYTQPEYLPEFEGGWFQPWGGHDYDTCATELSPEFADVYYKNNIGSRVTLQNIYMVFGGTNWGHSAAPVVYTSYDYSAPLRETREIRDKLKQTKLIGLFTRVSSDLLKTHMEGNGTGYTSDSSIYTWALHNPDTNAGFYVLAHKTSSSRSVTEFSLNVTTSAGAISIPDIQLDGRQSKIIVTDYQFGKSSALLYSSAEVLTYANLDVDVLVLYLNVGQKGLFVFKDERSKLSFQTYGNTNVTASVSSHGTQYIYTQAEGVTAVKFSNGVLAYLLDKESAWNFFAPPTTSNPQVAPDEHILVQGPYLVRGVTINHDTVEIIGDNANTTSLEVYAGNLRVKVVKWNGKAIKSRRTAYGSLVGRAPGAEDARISPPSLDSWSAQDTLPDIQPDYDDSRWTVCNKTASVNAVPLLSLPVLYSGDYGYHAGTKVYRGRFDGRNVTGANVTVQNGVASGWAAWLNGQFVGGVAGAIDLAVTSAVLSFNSSLLHDRDNVLTVVTDYTGHDQNSVRPKGTQNPRGILGATLIGGGKFTSWRIQGNAGGEKNIDPVRGPINEGGLYGERMGWHLPGYKAPRSAAKSSPLDGISGAEGRFYTTTFTLKLDRDLDVPIGLQLGAPAGTQAVVQVFMNGYQFGHYLPHIGPQSLFPFPPGVINNRGENTLAISMWALTDAGAKLDQVELVAYGKYRSGFDFNQDWGYLQPQWKDNRRQYA